MEQDWSAENAFQPMQKPMSEEPEWTVADQNHDAILLIPDILARLVQLLTFDKVSFGREVRKFFTLRPITNFEQVIIGGDHCYDGAMGMQLGTHKYGFVHVSTVQNWEGAWN